MTAALNAVVTCGQKTARMTVLGVGAHTMVNILLLIAIMSGALSLMAFMLFAATNEGFAVAKYSMCVTIAALALAAIIWLIP